MPATGPIGVKIVRNAAGRRFPSWIDRARIKPGHRRWCHAAAFVCRLCKPDRQSCYAVVVVAPVDDLALLPEDVVAAIVVQLEGRDRRRGQDQGYALCAEPVLCAVWPIKILA